MISYPRKSFLTLKYEPRVVTVASNRDNSDKEVIRHPGWQVGRHHGSPVVTDSQGHGRGGADSERNFKT